MPVNELQSPADSTNKLSVGARAIIPDSEFKNKIAFKLVNALFLTYAKLIHDVTVVGAENVPKNEGCLMTSTHSTHNVDILTACLAMYESFGRLVRGLYHRTVILYFPALNYLGGVSGYRGAAEDLVRGGFLTACIPGGAEEGLTGHENAYTLRWKSSSGTMRTGFARVALNLGKCSIVPIVGQNGDEMRFNPIFWAVNALGISHMFDKLMSSLNGYPTLQRTIFAVAIRLWFCLTLFSVPIPVKYTIHILEPVPIDPAKDTAEDISKKLHDITQAKYEELQGGHAKNYTRALAQRGISLHQVQAVYAAIAVLFLLSLIVMPYGSYIALAIAVLLCYPFSIAVLLLTVIPLIDLFC